MKEKERIENPPVTRDTSQPVAVRCPVCNGFGTLKYGTMTCHACNGKGYLVIGGNKFDEKEIDYEDRERPHFN